ncbi:MAG: LysR family transcriptional regulator [Lachnospiraceae bacterium]|nr:LysR family transcriptional regulator [Lachnospiraceae bacterium]
MELRHIRYFMAVAEELNFTRAAEKLCIAQPPLSRQIQNLEEELDAKLFIRHPRSLQLTEEGIRFKQYAKQILSLVDKSAEEVREMGKGLQGTLYLASVEGRGPWLFSEWIAGFQALHPHVQYTLWNGNSDDVTERIRNRLCDLAIIVEPLNKEGIQSLRVFQEPWIALIPKENPLASQEGDTVEMVQLAPYELIVPSRSSRLMEIESWFTSNNKTPRFRCQVAHMINAYELTRQGVGISIYPASASALIQDDSVCAKRLVEPSVIASYALIWKKGHQLSHVAQEFLDYVQDRILSSV